MIPVLDAQQQQGPKPKAIPLHFLTLYQQGLFDLSDFEDRLSDLQAIADLLQNFCMHLTGHDGESFNPNQCSLEDESTCALAYRINQTIQTAQTMMVFPQTMKECIPEDLISVIEEAIDQGGLPPEIADQLTVLNLHVVIKALLILNDSPAFKEILKSSPELVKTFVDVDKILQTNPAVLKQLHLFKDPAIQALLAPVLKSFFSELQKLPIEIMPVPLLKILQTLQKALEPIINNQLPQVPIIDVTLLREQAGTKTIDLANPETLKSLLPTLQLILASPELQTALLKTNPKLQETFKDLKIIEVEILPSDKAPHDIKLTPKTMTELRAALKPILPTLQAAMMVSSTQPFVSTMTLNELRQAIPTTIQQQWQQQARSADSVNTRPAPIVSLGDIKRKGTNLNSEPAAHSHLSPATEKPTYKPMPTVMPIANLPGFDAKTFPLIDMTKPISASFPLPSFKQHVTASEGKLAESKGTQGKFIERMKENFYAAQNLPNVEDSHQAKKQPSTTHDETPRESQWTARVEPSNSNAPTTTAPAPKDLKQPHQTNPLINRDGQPMATDYPSPTKGLGPCGEVCRCGTKGNVGKPYENPKAEAKPITPKREEIPEHIDPETDRKLDNAFGRRRDSKTPLVITDPVSERYNLNEPINPVQPPPNPEKQTQSGPQKQPVKKPAPRIPGGQKVK